jgi:hypothetical protein
MQPQQPQQMNPNTLQDRARNIVYGFCTVFTCPVEVIIRPWYGTRYFGPFIPLLSLFTLFALAGLAEFTTPFTSPLFMAARMERPHELFDLGSLCHLFLLLLLLHGIRLYRRAIHMHLEKHSRFEGPALFFFQLVPGGKNIWVTRIFLEPLFVFLTASLLHRLFIITSPLESYLWLSAACLALKNFLVWRIQRDFIRDILDIQNAAPIIVDLVQDMASDKQLEPIHLASFPKDIPADIRRAAVTYMASIISPGTTIPEPKGESHAINE